MKDILIVGVGNLLLRDEGIGVYIVEKLAQIGLPTNVQIIDCGTDFSSIFTKFGNHKKIIIVDAICAGGKPGQVYRFDYDEFKKVENSVNSVHQLSVIDTLKLLKQVQYDLSSCKIMLIGIEPGTISFGIGLSKKVKASVDKAIFTILREILPKKEGFRKAYVKKRKTR